MQYKTITDTTATSYDSIYLNTIKTVPGKKGSFAQLVTKFKNDKVTTIYRTIGTDEIMYSSTASYDDDIKPASELWDVGAKENHLKYIITTTYFLRKIPI